MTSPDLGMGSAYQVLSHRISMTENTEKLFGVILDVFLSIDLWYFYSSKLQYFKDLHFSYFIQSKLKSCRAIHRVAGKATHR